MAPLGIMDVRLYDDCIIAGGNATRQFKFISIEFKYDEPWWSVSSWPETGGCYTEGHVQIMGNPRVKNVRALKSALVSSIRWRLTVCKSYIWLNVVCTVCESSIWSPRDTDAGPEHRSSLSDLGRPAHPGAN